MFVPKNPECFARKIDGTPNLGAAAPLTRTPIVRKPSRHAVHEAEHFNSSFQCKHEVKKNVCYTSNHYIETVTLNITISHHLLFYGYEYIAATLVVN